MSTSAKIIEDSISPEGVRLTTFQITCHRFVLAEMNTHRTLSRNSASSRAIPLTKQLKRVMETPALPLKWAGEQRGMQGGDEIEDIEEAEELWLAARDASVKMAGSLGFDHHVHKSIANRLLEPFMWHTIVVTATAWRNFFDQRCSSLAQPEIKAVADLMNEAYVESDPSWLAEGQWHLPYIDEETRDEVRSRYLEYGPERIDRELAPISAARCARVSYLTQEGKRDIAEDLRLYDRLTERQKDTIAEHDPIHWSPLEHVATPWGWNRQEGCIHFGQDEDVDEDTYTCIRLDHLPRIGNLLGWRSLRTTVEAEKGVVTYR